MIRWEREENGDRRGHSGEFVVATVAPGARGAIDIPFLTITAMNPSGGGSRATVATRQCEGSRAFNPSA
jgi:hypothetical protein